MTDSFKELDDESTLMSQRSQLISKIDTEQSEIETDKTQRLDDNIKMTSLEIDSQMAGALEAPIIDNMINSINDYVTKINNEITNITKQEDKKKAELAALNKYEDALTQLQTAPNLYSQAKYEWYIADPAGCNTPENNKLVCQQLVDNIHAPLLSQGNKLKDISLMRNAELFSDTIDTVVNLDNMVMTIDRLGELYNLRKMEYEQLKNAKDNQRFSTWTNNRKVVYENWATKSVDNIKFYITICYYCLFVVYLFIGDFFVKHRYKDYKSWILICVYLAIPYFMNWIVIKIYYIVYQIKYFIDTRLPKNVYVNL